MFLCVPACAPTALLIAVVPAIVVAIAVPEAANAVAVLAVELILLALPGSCGEKKKGFRGQIMRRPQKQRADTVQECDKRQPSLSSVDILSKTALTSGKLWPFVSGSDQRAEEKKQRCFSS